MHLSMGVCVCVCVCTCVCLCVHVCVCSCVEQFYYRSPFCYAGQLTLRHKLLAGDVFLLTRETQTCQILFQSPDHLNTSAC